MKRLSVGLIGAGPRGLAVLERLSALIGEPDRGVGFDIHVVDPGVPGQGIHRETQPDHLLTNTAAGSTTVFVDSSVQGAGPPRPGPSLGQWLTQAGYRLRDGRLVQSSDGATVANDTFISRAILGRYLAWAYREVVARMPAHVEVSHHPCRAVAIDKRRDGRFDVALSSDARLQVDFLFVTTGHSGSGPQPAEAALHHRVDALRSRNPRLAYLRVLEPIERLDEIDADARVAIAGMGLTAFDAVSMFTHGRGGTFTKVGEQRLRYNPSGREPRITLFSRQGLPPVSKPVDKRTAAGRTHVPKLFTLGLVEDLKRRKGKLDWARDLQPWLEKEMALRLARAESSNEPDPFTFEPSPSQTAAVDAFLRPWAHVAIADASAHRDFIRRYLEHDIASSFVGNVDDPFMAIVEIVRDLNDVARAAVDFCGLTPASHRSFLRDWCSIANRIATGPPKERSMELLALIDAGILSIHEPDPVVDLDESAACFKLRSDAFGYVHEDRFDVLVQARIGLLQSPWTEDPLFRHGFDRGIFAAFDNGGFAPSGIAVDTNLNVLDAAGRPHPNAWAMGFVIEGAHYYTSVLPCPFANSRSLRDAGMAVMAMIDRADASMRQPVHDEAEGTGDRDDLRLLVPVAS